MPIARLEDGLLEFQTAGKRLKRTHGYYPAVYQRCGPEIPLMLEFAGGSAMSFRFELRGQWFTTRQNYFHGRDGTKEVFLSPCHYALRDVFMGEGYVVKEAGEDQDMRVRQSFEGRPLERIAFEQNKREGIDTVVIQSAVGQLRFVHDYGFLIAVEEIPKKGRKTIYEVGEKGSWYREGNLMVAGALAQEPKKGSPLEAIGKALTEDPASGLMPISEKDLFFEVKNNGRIVHLGPRIR